MIADVEHARKHRDRITERLAKATHKVEEERHELARLLAEDADDKSVGIVQASHRGALDMAEHVAEALIVAEKHLSDLEKQLADLIDQEQRVETVARINAEAKELTEVKSEFNGVCAKFAEIAGRVGRHTYEGRAIASFMEVAPQEIAAGLAMVCSAMDGYSRRVQAGCAPAKIDEPEGVQTATPATPQPETAGLFAMRNIAWAEGDAIRLHPRGWPVSLPAHIAKHAVELRAALPPGHHEAAQLANSPTRSREMPRIADCVTLDETSAKAKAESEQNVELSASTPDVQIALQGK